MTRKCLIALAVIALLAGSVQAHPSWGVTTSMNWEWAKKAGPTIPVYMKIVRWADIYAQYPILLIQQSEGYFEGCTWLQVCNNFQNLRVDAVLVDLKVVKVKEWWISLVEYPDEHAQKGATPPTATPATQYERDKTHEIVGAPNLSSALGWLHLCVKAVGVDPQSQEFDPDNPLENVKRVAEVELTMYPNDAPGASDAFFQDIGTALGQAADLGALDWNPVDGGGGGIPNGIHYLPSIN